MKNLFFLTFLIAISGNMKAQNPDYSTYPVYENNDLGMQYTAAASHFKVWAPSASEVTLRIYQEGTGGSSLKTVNLEKKAKGVWETSLSGDWAGRFYTVQTKIGDKWMGEVPDPYAKAVGVNGKRGAILPLASTNPEGWDNDSSPALKNVLDAVIYELHVRDATIAASSGVKKPGKYAGLTETGTKNKDKLSTGLDHIRELGVTHVHLLPVYDFYSIDESMPEKAQYNWGYDPLNYNTPEGSYATDAVDPAVRIREFKQLVQAMHQNGLRVVMDVVYNHTMLTEDSYFNQVVPGYYYRQTATGAFSNASGCNNETASERPMMRSYMLESMKYWMEQYHIDGFRVDLMGIHDIETMNLISRELHRIKPDVLLYGEGWTSGDSPLPEEKRALKKNAAQLDHIAVFSDDLRDGAKGSVFDHPDRGFVSGKKGMEESVKFGIVAATQHPQLDYSKVNYSKAPWAAQPYHCINYVSCHDNHTLWDRLQNSNPRHSEKDRINMHLLAETIVLTSQGIPFLLAGTEFLRTKKNVENSFKSSDEINLIDWDRKTRYQDANDYIAKLIRLRRNHPAFRMRETAMIQENLRFIEVPGPGIIAYTINGKAAGDTWKTILVAFNANEENIPFDLPKGKWNLVLYHHNIDEKGISKVESGVVNLPARGAVIAVLKK